MYVCVCWGWGQVPGAFVCICLLSVLSPQRWHHDTRRPNNGKNSSHLLCRQRGRAGAEVEGRNEDRNAEILTKYKWNSSWTDETINVGRNVLRKSLEFISPPTILVLTMLNTHLNNCRLWSCSFLYLLTKILNKPINLPTKASSVVCFSSCLYAALREHAFISVLSSYGGGAGRTLRSYLYQRQQQGCHISVGQWRNG